MASRSVDPHLLSIADAAAVLGVSTDAVSSLASAGYLTAIHESRFVLSDLKAFVARNADNGSGNLFLTESGSVDADDLLAALEDMTGHMAERTLDIFEDVFPDARAWAVPERARFLSQAKDRFEAILSVAKQGPGVDETLVHDFKQVGAAVAEAGSPLPQLLVLLRISRDLVVQTAVELADQRGRHWSLPLALLLTRILPAMDRLTDSLAEGYWEVIGGAS